MRKMKKEKNKNKECPEHNSTEELQNKRKIIMTSINIRTLKLSQKNCKNNSQHPHASFQNNLVNFCPSIKRWKHDNCWKYRVLERSTIFTHYSKCSDLEDSFTFEEIVLHLSNLYSLNFPLSQVFKSYDLMINTVCYLAPSFEIVADIFLVFPYLTHLRSLQIIS